MFSHGKISSFELGRQSPLHSVKAALEVCTVKNEKGKAKFILVKYLLIVPYPLRLPFPSCPGANTGATP